MAAGFIVSPASHRSCRTVISRIIYAALIAGIGAGLLLFLLQHYQLLPLLQEAERYRYVASDTTGSVTDLISAYQSTRQILALDIMTATGLAILPALVLWLKKHTGIWRGMGLGILGYLAFYVVPTLVHQPTLNELSPSDVAEQDQWWMISAVCTWLGLVLIFHVPNRLMKVAGIAILLAQLFYLPNLSANQDLIPSELERDFALRLYILNALLWLILGALAGGSLRLPKAVKYP